jgi:hypothetical protein
MSVDDITGAMTATYGSLSEPDFGLVAQRLEQHPYGSLLAALGARFEVEDDTDSNDDHGLSLGLDRDGRSWALLLSVVGPYAAFGRVGQAWDAVLTDRTPDLDDHERWVLHQLRQAGVRALSQEELEQPVGLSLFNTPAGRVLVYHALFSDIPGLPWDREGLRRLGLIDS